MQPLAACPASRWRALRGVLADIDDTITTEGRLTAAAYAAMECIRASGLMFVPITGRPAGWCDHIARMWPVDAVVGENGAFWFRYDHDLRRMQRRYMADDAERKAQRDRLAVIARRIVDEVPGCCVAADQAYREVDLAIDFCEDVPRLPGAAVEHIAKLMRAQGLTVKVSSIHVNGWFGTHDKLTTTCDLFDRAFGIEPRQLAERYTYIGDSPNDEPMFGFFDCAVGVANVHDFAAGMQSLPAYATHARAGSGFAEFVTTLVGARA